MIYDVCRYEGEEGEDPDPSLYDIHMYEGEGQDFSGGGTPFEYYVEDGEEAEAELQGEQKRHDPYSVHKYDSLRDCMEKYEGESDYSEGEESDCMSEYSDYTGYAEYTVKYEHLSEYELDQLSCEGGLLTIQSHDIPTNAETLTVTGAVAEQPGHQRPRGGQPQRPAPQAGQPVCHPPAHPHAAPVQPQQPGQQGRGRPGVMQAAFLGALCWACSSASRPPTSPTPTSR